jgi:hypothetical protein
VTRSSGSSLKVRSNVISPKALVMTLRAQRCDEQNRERVEQIAFQMGLGLGRGVGLRLRFEPDESLFKRLRLP